MVCAVHGRVHRVIALFAHWRVGQRKKFPCGFVRSVACWISCHLGSAISGAVGSAFAPEERCLPLPCSHLDARGFTVYRPPIDLASFKRLNIFDMKGRCSITPPSALKPENISGDEGKHPAHAAVHPHLNASQYFPRYVHSSWAMLPK